MAAVTTPFFSAASMAALTTEVIERKDNTNGVYALIIEVTKAIEKRTRAGKYHLNFAKIDWYRAFVKSDGLKFVEKYGDSVCLDDHFEIKLSCSSLYGCNGLIIKWRSPENKAIFRTHFENLGFKFYKSYDKLDAIIFVPMESLTIEWGRE